MDLSLVVAPAVPSVTSASDLLGFCSLLSGEVPIYWNRDLTDGLVSCW